MVKNFDKAMVTDSTISEFKAAARGLKKGYKHFLNGFRLAAEEICKEWGGFENLESPKDQKRVFELIQEIAEPQVGLSPQTFTRYCKIARWCIIYHVSWDIGSEATKPQLQRCKQMAAKLKTGTWEEKMERAWAIVKKEAAEEAIVKKQRQEKLIEEENAKDAAKTIVHIPLPKDGQDEDAYWTEYLSAQVSHIKKHMDILKGGSAVKTLVLTFYGQAVPIVQAAKVKSISKEAA